MISCLEVIRFNSNLLTNNTKHQAVNKNEKHYSESNRTLSHQFNGLITEKEPDQFNVKVEDLKSESIKKLKNNWSKIIDKYSKIKDEYESDEIDIITGKIITDNGHLKNLDNLDKNNIKNVNIWREDYEKEELRIRARDWRGKVKREQMLNKSLKLDLQHHSSDLDSAFLNGDNFKDNSPTKGSIPTTFHTKEESPTKKRRVYIMKEDDDQSAEEESESDFESSNDSYSVGEDEEEESDDISTTCDKSQEFFEDKAIRKREQFGRPKRAKSEDILDLCKTSQLRPIKFQNESTKSSPIKKNNIKFEDGLLPIKAGLERKSSPTKKSRESSPMKKQRESSPLEFEELQFLSQSSPKPAVKTTILDSDIKLSESPIENFKSKSNTYSSSASPDVEDQFCTIDEVEFLNFNKSKKPQLYTCCFEMCDFKSKRKSSYKTHLLNDHSNALSKMGYPIEFKSAEDKCSSKLVNNTSLNEIFPLKYKLPKTFKFLKCNETTDNNEVCQYFCNNDYDLENHKTKGDCYYGKILLFCPILGCGYLTDGGFEEWRDHLFQAKHLEYDEEKDEKEEEAEGSSLNPIEIDQEDEIMSSPFHKTSPELPDLDKQHITSLKPISDIPESPPTFSNTSKVRINRRIVSIETPNFSDQVDHDSSNLKTMNNSYQDYDEGYDSIYELFQ
ncbi:uncharacterized protein KGF55_005547 [Candida pseudojiufengensis]|uniref:uncharacterized protein n=1 Tax=Candida pseudojiufengensis TaxID=497109 RepID=UPI00222436DE|nr:uncharacterized protein KGF55_005547 [Candida pseudojiufengensis]KAI5959057.1 hypothetical protein KGF55_005547 [Candida pseudojiufengensis]